MVRAPDILYGSRYTVLHLLRRGFCTLVYFNFSVIKYACMHADMLGLHNF